MSGLIGEFSKSGIIGQASNHFTIDRVDGVACFRQVLDIHLNNL